MHHIYILCIKLHIYMYLFHTPIFCSIKVNSYMYSKKHISRKIVSFTVWSTLHERCEARKKTKHIFLWCDDCFHWKSKTVYFFAKRKIFPPTQYTYIVLIMRFNYACSKIKTRCVEVMIIIDCFLLDRKLNLNLLV